MKALISLFAIAMTFAWCFAASPLGDWGAAVESPAIDLTGGPDLWGYTWIDSNEPGGPIYYWKDISTQGTLVYGLGDDNYVGPFPIGFTFHYYWYDVTQYWIGSNGYLKFGTAYNMAQPFPASIPLVAAPNDFVALYVADWYPGQNGQGQVYRWNNGDSLVVSFINVPAWVVGPGGGSHTFQVICSRLDSNITFQYGAQQGTVSNNDILVGIENANGMVGLERAHDTYMPFAYAVEFVKPNDPQLVFHDMAAVASMNENSNASFLLNGEAYLPWGRIKNVGTVAENNYSVRCTIIDKDGAVVYTETIAFQNQGLAPGNDRSVTFPAWTPAVDGNYRCKIESLLGTDENPSNDIKQSKIIVITLEEGAIWVMYDDGTAEMSWSWMGGQGGLANRFVPPLYPIQVDCVRFFMSGGGTSPFTAQILDDDGPNGQPGTVLFQQNISTPSAGWHGAATAVEIPSGAFYVAWQMVDSLTRPLGVDTTGQLGSRQTWEYTGVWAPFRDAEWSDFMIRAKIHQLTANPNVTIDLVYTSGSPVPRGGGPLAYTLQVTNNESASQPFQYWTTYSQGSTVLPAFGPASRTAPAGPGYVITRYLTQMVPGSLPPGAWNYNGYLGAYPSTVWATDSFPFTKNLAGDGGAYYSEGALFGWEEEEPEVVAATPMGFELLGNYPNPFNPTTTISYSLGNDDFVNLNVFDLSGRKVATVVNGWREAGEHEAIFDASGLPSGIYIYRLTAGSFSASQKMVLMK